MRYAPNTLCRQSRTRVRNGTRSLCEYPAAYIVWAEGPVPTATVACQHHLGYAIETYIDASGRDGVHVTTLTRVPAGQDVSGPEYARGFQRAVLIVSDALHAARMEPRPQDRAMTERGGRITALGGVLNALMAEGIQHAGA